MNRSSTTILATIALAATWLVFSVYAQPPTVPNDSNPKRSGPNGQEISADVHHKEIYYPAMTLGYRPGTYLTIEGVSGHEVKGDQTFVMVDTVNGRKLSKPTTIPIRNAHVTDKQRCILKGYESGEMVGEPPAVREAAREQGKELPPSATAWRWQSYFVVLIPLKPETALIGKPSGITKP